MSEFNLIEALRRSLEDGRLSRGERSALRDLVGTGAHGSAALAEARRAAFQLAQDRLGDPMARPVLEWLEGVIKLLAAEEAPPPRACEEACFSPRDNCPKRITQLASAARRSIDVCVFTITDDRLTDALLAAVERGVSLRVVTDNEKAFDEGSDIRRLEQAGIPVRQDQSPFHMHHKFAIFDQELLLTGSYNWTRGAAENNQENFLITANPTLRDAYAKEFERLWMRWG